MKQLTPVGELNRAVSSNYRHAAGGVLAWPQERQFFDAQIKKNWQIARAVENRVPATIESLRLAALECAAMGLSMSPNAQLVYFIPRRSRKRKPDESKSEYEAKTQIIVTATPSYRGLAYSAMNYAGAAQIAAEVVYQAELDGAASGDKNAPHFIYNGPMREPKHRPTLNPRQRNESDAVGVYAIVKMQDGTFRCEYVDAPTVLKIRQLSDFPNGLMWTKLWTEGWRKVPIRRICKTVMVTSSRMAVAIEALNTSEGISFDESPAGQIEHEDATRGAAGLGEALKHKAIEHDLSDEPEPKDALQLQNLAESSDPPGSIEWWWSQIHDAQDMERMDTIKAAALTDGVDRSDDADEFRRIYAERCKQIREAA